MLKFLNLCKFSRGFICSKNFSRNSQGLCFVFLKSPILGTKKEILKLILSDCKKLFGGEVSLKIAAGKLVQWCCTPQPYGLAVKRLLAFPR